MKRSQFDTLPEALKTQIHKLFKEKNFADFDGATTEINAILEQGGYEVTLSRSVVHRQAQKLKKILDGIRDTQEASKFIMEAFPDEDKTTSQANLRMLNDSLFKLQIEVSELNGDEKMTPYAKSNILRNIGEALTKITRADVAVSKYKNELKEKLDAKFGEISPRTGIDMETLRVIREEIYGIVS